MIRPEDKLSTVLARDERLLDVLVAATPNFEALRSPGLRKNMAPRVTVEQAAQMAGLEAAILVARLNGALADLPAASPAPRPAPEHEESAAQPAALPAALAAIPAERLLDVDVREDLRAGIEPFARIMGAARSLSPGVVLRIRAIFEPVPLYGVFRKKGFDHFTERIAADDWRVWFFRAEGTAAADSAAPASTTAATPRSSHTLEAPQSDDDTEDVLVLDVRGLEPPEPMVRTLELLETMPRGKTLLQLNVRVPQFLLPHLEERGFVYEIREQSTDLVRLFIRHRPDRQGER